MLVRCLTVRLHLLLEFHENLKYELSLQEKRQKSMLRSDDNLTRNCQGKVVAFTRFDESKEIAIVIEIALDHQESYLVMTHAALNHLVPPVSCLLLSYFF